MDLINEKNYNMCLTFQYTFIIPIISNSQDKRNVSKFLNENGLLNELIISFEYDM